MEYKEFAKYYDRFYKNKDYEKEVGFLMNFIKEGDEIIDIGCGTGIHASLISQKGFYVDCLDLNDEMLEVAKTRLKSNFYSQNILNINIDKKYDVIISMFAVLNHLKSVDELEKCLSNLRGILKDDGKIIIDLHNPQSSGSKKDSFDNMTRVMEWNYDKKNRIENSKITFMIGYKRYDDSHVFKIFNIDEVKECCTKIGLKVLNVYENYDLDKEGKETSKNLQFVICN